MRKEQVSLDTLGFGAAAEMFQAELEKLVFNIADPNTKPELKRNKARGARCLRRTVGRGGARPWKQSRATLPTTLSRIGRSSSHN